MVWTQRKPASICSLGEAMPLYRTSACRFLAEGYGALVKQNNGAIPSKNMFDVTACARAIPQMALCAVRKPDQCIYRIVGEGVKDRLGLNPTGRNYYDLVPDERRASAASAMNMVVGVPCGFRADIEQIYSDGSTVAVEATGFPLRSEESNLDGYIVFADQPLDGVPPLSNFRSQLLGANVMRRDLIDLGFGVDESFVDLVRDV